MPRRHSPVGIAAQRAPPAASATSSPSSPTSPVRHRWSAEVIPPPATSPLSRSGNSRSPQHHRPSGSETTKSPPPSDVAPSAATAVTGGGNSARRLHPANTLRPQTTEVRTPATPTGRENGARVILPYHLRRGWGGARTTVPMKASAITNRASAQRSRQHHSSVLLDESEEEKNREGKQTEPTVDASRRSSQRGHRGSIPSSDKSSSTSTSSFHAARRRAPSAHSVLSEEVMERLHTLAVEGADKREDNARCRDAPWRKFATCALAVVVLVVVLGAYLASNWSSSSRRLGHDSSCNSAGCQLLASKVIDRLDASVDPCDDIEAHVCGPVTWDSDLVTDTTTEVMRVWMQRGAVHLESRKRPEAAFSLYHACMAPAEDSISELKAFMRDRGLLWPTYGGSKLHALYVLLDLLINWGVPFWFELSLRRLPNDRRYSMYINRVQMNKWRRQQQVSDDLGRLKEYADLFYDLYGASKEDRSHADTMLQHEKEMHRIIEPPGVDHRIERGTLTELRVQMSAADSFTPNISSHTWLRFLNHLLRPHKFVAEDYILIDDIGLSQTINEIFKHFSNQDLLYTLGWWFVQQFSVIASLDGGVASYGSAAMALANRPSDCYALAESRFRRQLFLERAHASLGTAGMRQVGRLLSNIRATTIRLLSSLPWMDSQSRKDAVAIVESTEFEGWKRHLGDNRDDADTQEKLRAMTSSDAGSSVWEELQASTTEANETTSVGDRRSDVRLASPVAPLPRIGEREKTRASPRPSVVRMWIDSAISYKRQFPKWPLEDSLLHRHLSYSTLVDYDYWWNSVFLQMGALAEPFFYLDGPPSANYGGLGVVVARHLFKAFNYMHGTWLDAKRNQRQWLSHSSRKSYEQKLACVNDSCWTMAHVAAIEMAHAAVFGAGSERSEEANDPRRNWLPVQRKDLSPEMVFFLVYCRATCQSKYRHPPNQTNWQRPHCGDVLKHVAGFGRAFKCPADSRMVSSVPKCSFFGT
ncbi:membrane metallo-endopeptidase-like 1 isoform X2 [Dermacentor albipictus]|uniref:membrane metallo-endopeptidase-like 1 isoform X2 n=1 Tax=Dermacentor albipictus TaxID=60249 RepID=UPI0038FC969E